VPGNVGISPGTLAPGGTVLVKPGTLFVIPLMPLVNGRKRLLNPAVTLRPVKMLVLPKFVSGNGLVPTMGLGGT
jgi:hypothetical protein